MYIEEKRLTCSIRESTWKINVGDISGGIWNVEKSMWNDFLP